MTKDLLKIGANTSAQLAARFVTSVATLVVTLLVTHNLSKADWGVFITITSYTALFYLLADFGLNGVIIRQISQKKEQTGTYFNNLLSLRLILSLGTILLALIFLSLTNHPNFIKIGIIISLINILTLSFYNTALMVFQKNLRYDQAALADISGSLITLAASYLFIISHLSIIFVVVAYVIGGLVRAFLSLILSAGQVGKISLALDFGLWRSLVYLALPVGLTLVFSQVVANIDKQVVYLANYDPKLQINNEIAAGFYGLAYRVFEFGIIIPAFFVNSLYPLLLKDKEAGEKVFLISLVRYGRLLLGISFFAVLFILIFGPQIISLFGDFDQSIRPLRILSLGYPVFYLTPLIMWTFISLNKEKILPFIYGLAAIFNFTANVYFVPRFGFNAAAIITVITEIIIFVLAFSVLSSHFNFFNRKIDETS